MKKKLLYIASLDSIHTLKWINFFLNLDYEVSVISLTKKIENYKFSKPCNLHVYCKFKNKYLNILYCLLSVILKRNFFSQNHIIHVHYIGFNGLISLILKTDNLILSAWGSDIKINKGSHIKYFFLKYIFKKTKLITTDSNQVKNLMIGIDKDLTHKIKIINFGINTKFFSKKEYCFKTEKKLKLQDFKDHLKIISLRNHHKIYDIKTLILSINKLVKVNKKVICLIYGTGPETYNLKKLTTDLGLKKNINFMGKYSQDELPFIFSLVDCYVSTSLSDAGLSASTAEAMSCEVPSISSNNSENKIWIDHGKSGFLYNDKNIEELTEIFINLKSFDLLSIGNESRKIIQKNNDYENEMTKVDILYNGL